MAMREADKEDNEANIDEIKEYRDAKWVTLLDLVEDIWPRFE
jgi:hypothetical protein